MSTRSGAFRRPQALEGVAGEAAPEAAPGRARARLTCLLPPAFPRARPRNARGQAACWCSIGRSMLQSVAGGAARKGTQARRSMLAPATALARPRAAGGGPAFVMTREAGAARRPCVARARARGQAFRGILRVYVRSILRVPLAALALARADRGEPRRLLITASPGASAKHVASILQVPLCCKFCYFPISGVPVVIAAPWRGNFVGCLGQGLVRAL